MCFSWVKRHTGIEGNELVDRMAKEAAVEDGPVLYDKMPREVIITWQKGNGRHVVTAVDEYGDQTFFFPISEE